MRRMMIICAGAAMLAAMSGSNVAMARGGGGHGGGGHGGGGMGHGGMGGGMGRGGLGFGGAHFVGAHMGGMRFAGGHPVVFAHGFHGRRFLRTRFAFVGGGGWGYGGCYTRVWTYWGWVWRNVCY
jgi:hypothetical protein